MQIEAAACLMQGTCATGSGCHLFRQKMRIASSCTLMQRGDQVVSRALGAASNELAA